jgi:hypothetical protein
MDAAITDYYRETPCNFLNGALRTIAGKSTGRIVGVKPA